MTASLHEPPLPLPLVAVGGTARQLLNVIHWTVVHHRCHEFFKKTCLIRVCVCLWLQYKILNVPLSSHLAANHFNQQQAEQEERMRMKKLTLDINERQEQEDYQGVWAPPSAHTGWR